VASKRSPGAVPTGLRVGALAVAAIVAAEAAVWLLRPRDGVVHPDPVPASRYFSPRELTRAHDFRSGQRLLFFAGLALEGGVLVLLASGRPRTVRRALDRAAARPLLGAAVAGAGISLIVASVSLPLQVASHDRAVDVGLSTQRLGGFLSDAAKGGAVGIVLAGVGAVVAVGFQRRFRRGWWLAATASVIAFEVVFVWLTPVVLAPLFNRFTPLPEGATRREVVELANRAGVDIGQVYEVDASRQTTAANAYVNGLGSTKRVVLYDTLLGKFDPGEVRSVVAHELGHVRHRDLWLGMAWVALATPMAMLAAQAASERLGAATGARPGTPAIVPALALSLALVGFGGSIVSNQLSRRIEARADSFALELTDDPQSFIALERRLTTTSLGDPDPSAALQWLFGTHPTPVQRLGAAVAFERGARP
jgi:STE24 endopeptidase